MKAEYRHVNITVSMCESCVSVIQIIVTSKGCSLEREKVCNVIDCYSRNSLNIMNELINSDVITVSGSYRDHDLVCGPVYRRALTL